jgi:hypothetical protein
VQAQLTALLTDQRPTSERVVEPPRGLCGKFRAWRRWPAGVAFVLAGACAPPASAQLTHGPFLFLSNGQDSCGEFLAGSPQRQQLDIAWILGFISGADSRGATVSERVVGSSFRDVEAVQAWVQQYCRTHAFDYLPQAAEALRNEFAKRERRQ